MRDTRKKTKLKPTPGTASELAAKLRQGKTIVQSHPLFGLVKMRTANGKFIYER